MSESHPSQPLSGLWKPTQLQALHYGPNSVHHHLLPSLPTESSKAFILSTRSLAKTPLIAQVETLLQPGGHHAGTCTTIGQHAPISDLDSAASTVLSDPSITTIISIGGGSPIDSAKAISARVADTGRPHLFHIAIPTTLSAAECTSAAGFTSASGIKTGVAGPELAPHVILYDASFAAHTPQSLFLSTGIRALDHAVESMYHPCATEMPQRKSAMGAVGDLFAYLPRYKADGGRDLDVVTRLQLASFASLGFMGLNVKGGLGLSHGLGYALGSPYGIPHGMTSCLTLGKVVALKAQESGSNAAEIARLAPFVGGARSGDDARDAGRVGRRIEELVEELGLATRLGRDHGVGEDQVPVIVKAATKTERGELYDRVTELVKTLY